MPNRAKSSMWSVNAELSLLYTTQERFSALQSIEQVSESIVPPSSVLLHRMWMILLLLGNFVFFCSRLAIVLHREFTWVCLCLCTSNPATITSAREDLSWWTNRQAEFDQSPNVVNAVFSSSCSICTGNASCNVNNCSLFCLAAARVSVLFWQNLKMCVSWQREFV